MAMNTLIYIIEDDRKIARVFKAYLEGAGYTVRHFAAGKDALDAARANAPQLVVLDLMLPDITGEELFQDLKEVGDIPVIMVTSKSSEEERIAGLALGADDYLVKPFSPRELVFRVKAVLKRTGEVNGHPGDLLSFNEGDLVMDGQAFGIRRSGKELEVTSSEFRILYVMASSPGRVFSREQLIEKALDYHFEGYDRTIDAHVKNLRKKIETDPRKPEYIQTVYGAGYRFAGKKDTVA
jgi:two-component system OmpR family response regulator